MVCRTCLRNVAIRLVCLFSAAGLIFVALGMGNLLLNMQHYSLTKPVLISPINHLDLLRLQFLLVDAFGLSVDICCSLEGDLCLESWDSSRVDGIQSQIYRVTCQFLAYVYKTYKIPYFLPIHRTVEQFFFASRLELTLRKVAFWLVSSVTVNLLMTRQFEGREFFSEEF